jgi:16S rRNA C967 or C1407 C5-methylase (RsmB/RsmF family)
LITAVDVPAEAITDAAAAPAEPAQNSPLRRYAEIVDDVAALIASCATPLPRVVWANPLRGDVAETAALLERAHPTIERLRWLSGAWRMPPTERPGNWVEFKLGLIHAQEEAALWAVPMLGVLPGERVLDLCASPGNKTAQLAIATGNTGTVVANERYGARIDALRFNLDRLGVANTVVTNRDGHGFRYNNELFDRVLADVPCSCEGTARKPRGNRREDDSAWRAQIVQVQVGLLRAAILNVRPGGTVLYCTCTFAPEENEFVLNSIDTKSAVIEPIELPAGLRSAPGITSWEGRTFRDDVVNAARIWPHHNDTGGFFVARLRRI